MKREKMIEQLSAFVTRASYEDMSPEARRQIKVRVLDWLACAIGALGFEPIRRLRNQIEKFGGRPLVTMIGGGKTSPDRAAFYNGALTQYLGYNDSFLSGKALCNPSDTLPAVLAVSEYRGTSGKEFLTAAAVAYQVQCRLSEVSHLGDGGVGHISPGPYAATAGVARALNLNKQQTANAIAATIAAYSALPVPRVSGSPRCENILYIYSPFSMAQAVLLAMSSLTDAGEASEASTRPLKSVAPDPEIDWGEQDLEAVRSTAIKKFNAHIHSQTAIEAILHLRERRPCHPDQIERIELDTFEAANDLLGGNAEGVRTREEAYRSLPYLLAVALLDGEVRSSQYKTERILKEDVQSLMRKVVVQADSDFSRRFPEEMPARVRIFLRDGQILAKEKLDYEGYFTRPMAWERAVEKFKDLTVSQIGYEMGERIIEKVLAVEEIEVRELTGLLAGFAKSTEVKVREKVLVFQKHKPAA